jgi:hypothetical protein
MPTPKSARIIKKQVPSVTALPEPPEDEGDEVDLGPSLAQMLSDASEEDEVRALYETMKRENLAGGFVTVKHCPPGEMTFSRVGKFPLDELDLERVFKRCGGGEYRITCQTGSGLNVGEVRTISVSDHIQPVKGRRDAPATPPPLSPADIVNLAKSLLPPPPPPPDMSPLAAMLKEMGEASRRVQEAAEKRAEKAEQRAQDMQVKMMELLTSVDRTPAAPAPVVDIFDQLERFDKLTQRLKRRGDDGDGEEPDLLTKLLPAFVAMFSGGGIPGMGLPAPAPGAAPVSSGTAADGAGQPPPQASPGAGAQSAATAFNQALFNLLSTGETAQNIAAWIENVLTGSQLNGLCEMLEQQDWFSRLFGESLPADAPPIVHKVKLEEVRKELILDVDSTQHPAP